MRAFLAWCAANVVVVAFNALGAVVLFGLLSIVKLAEIENPWLVYAIGLAGIAGCIGILFKLWRRVTRSPSHRRA